MLDWTLQSMLKEPMLDNLSRKCRLQLDKLEKYKEIDGWMDGLQIATKDPNWLN
jgi:hypothetical protein